MKRRAVSVMGVLALAFAMTLAMAGVRAEPPAPAPAGANLPSAAAPEASTDNIIRTTDRGAAEYKKFEESLLRLVQRMERSSRPEEKAKAESLRKAIFLVNQEHVENRFQKLVTTLIGNKHLTTDELRNAAGQNEELIKILRDMLDVLLTDSELLMKQELMKKLADLIKQVDGLIKAEKIAQTTMDGNRIAAPSIAKEQKKITKTTESVARALGAKKPDDKKDGTEATAKKADPNNKAGEAKDDTKEAKGTPKDPKAGDPKAGDPKSGDPKPGDPKAGDPKAGDPKPGDPKKGDPKAGEPKAGPPKAGDPKAGDPKAGDPKAGDPKPGDPKPGDPKKPQDSKPSEAKNKPDQKGDSKGSAGEPKDGKPSDAKSSPSQGKPSQGPPPPDTLKKPGQKQPPQDDPNQPPPPPPSPQDEQARKQIQEVIDGQKKVEKDLEDAKKEEASKKTDKVIDDLAKLKAELEKRLKQLREEELERLLANLQARCQRMLAMQIEVQSGTKRVFSVIAGLEGHKASRAEEQQSQQLSTREGEIVKEANRTLNLMSSEGSAVAFAMSLENVRDDMQMIEKRLDKYDSGEFTQKMEQDVIDALTDMIDALKKAIQDQKDKKNNPKPPPSGPPPPQRLLDLLAELKLIKSQQVAVNKRTLDYAKHYQGEQTDDPLLSKELETLAKRQAKLEDMLKKIATGKNQ